MTRDKWRMINHFSAAGDDEAIVPLQVFEIRPRRERSFEVVMRRKREKWFSRSFVRPPNEVLRIHFEIVRAFFWRRADVNNGNLKLLQSHTAHDE